MTTTDSVKQHKLRKLIAWLSDKEGKGTEFTSLYVPRRTTIDETVTRLKNDYDSFKLEPKRVSDRSQVTFKNIIQQLKLHKDIPENGLAIFAGFFFGRDNESEVLNVEELSPPKPITIYNFVVDNHFHLETLREMLRDQRIVGLIVMDSKEASFGLLNGEEFELIENITSGIPGKSGKGGQSQRRYERERNMELTSFFHRVAEHATKAFLENTKVTVLIVGGPGLTKEEFAKGNYIHYELKKVLLKIVDTKFTGREGLREILDKSSEALINVCGPEEKSIMQRFEAELGKQDGLAIYGLQEVLDGLKKGDVEAAIVTDSTDLVELVATCKKCGTPKSQIMDKSNVKTVQEMLSSPCENCHAIEYEVMERDVVDVLEDAASQTDARVEVIFSAAEEKAKLTALGGVAALLRYRPT